jgi:hypothetical protein
MDLLDILEAVGNKLQMVNEKWDEVKKVWQTSIIGLALLLGLLLAGKAFMFIVIAVATVQRGMYHAEVYKDDETDEDLTDQG